MVWRRQESRSRTTWMIAAGALAGIAAAGYLAIRLSRRGGGRPGGELGRLEKGVVRRLRNDSVLGRAAIDVTAIAPGIVELSGPIGTTADAHHAVEVVQSVAGVNTVVNRLDVGEVEGRLSRRGTGDGARSAAGGSRWYGGGVGMGRRRQSRDTDPDRRDDRADMVADALETSPEEAVAELEADRLEGRVGAD